MLSSGTIQILIICITILIAIAITNESINIKRQDSIIKSNVDCDSTWLNNNQYLVSNGNEKCNLMERK